MKNHTKVYMNFFNYVEQDFIPCEMCNSKAVDVHHLERRNKTKNDYIENLVGLCRDCHNSAENDSSFNMFCRIKHLELVCQQIYHQIEYKKRYENRKNTNK